MRDEIVGVMRSSGDHAMATWRIARQLGKPTRSVREELGHMEREGIVRKYLRWSTVNNSVWQLVEGLPQ